MFIVNLIRGFFMALADSVPGVSGGTIAFILGFYDEFIGSLNTLVSKNSKEEKIQALQFLLKIGVGWAIGMITSVLFLASSDMILMVRTGTTNRIKEEPAFST